MDSRTVRWGFLYNFYPTRPSAKPNERPLPGKLAGDDDRRLMADLGRTSTVAVRAEVDA
jgi:hypothetical protein